MKVKRIAKTGCLVGLAMAAVCAAFFAGRDAVSGQRKLVAVVELDVEKGTAGPGEVFVLTDSVRSAATKVINTDCYTIMTRESMEVLIPQGIRMECLAGKCVVDIGRQLQAQFIVGGSIRRLNEAASGGFVQPEQQQRLSMRSGLKLGSWFL